MSITCPHCGHVIHKIDLDGLKPSRESLIFRKAESHKTELEFAVYLNKNGWAVKLPSTPISHIPCYPDLYALNVNRMFFFEVKSTRDIRVRIEAKQIKTLLKSLGFFGSHIEQKAFVATKFVLLNKWVVKEVSEPKTVTIHIDDESDSPFQNLNIAEIKRWKDYLALWLERKKLFDDLEMIYLRKQEESDTDDDYEAFLVSSEHEQLTDRIDELEDRLMDIATEAYK